MNIRAYLSCVAMTLAFVVNVAFSADEVNQDRKVADNPVALDQAPVNHEHSQSNLSAIKKPTIKKSPVMPQNTSLLPQLFQVALGLLFVLGLIIALAWFFRRFGQSQYAVKGNFRVVGGVHLGTREKVVLLQVGNQQLLLGVAPGRVNTLHVLEEPLDLNTPTPISESAFAKRLSTILQGKQR